MSLREIADMVGTSVSTVSRVLNHTSSTCASKELQDRIWEAARQTGYRPNEAARALQKAGTKTTAPPKIAIVLARITALSQEPFFAELFRSLQVELFQHGAVVEQVIYAEESLNQSLSHANGVIILGRCSGELLSHICKENRNVVGIWRNPTHFDVDEVVCDGKKAAELAMQHLLRLGHKKIAYIGDCSYESRYVGYCDTLIRNELPIDYGRIKQTNQSREEAQTAFLELLEEKRSQQTDFSAVFCANDNTAIRVLELLQEHRHEFRKTPISVISIDDIEQAQNTHPYLTTIRIPRDEMAHMAVQLLLDRIAKGHLETLRIEFPCRIIQRASCFPLSPGVRQ